jgi:autophagy-related protein 13
MASKLNSSDKKDLEKYSKYLVFKSIQVIVQSRLGERLQTDSKAFSSGSDWVIYSLYLLDSSVKKVNYII